MLLQYTSPNLLMNRPKLNKKTLGLVQKIQPLKLCIVLGSNPTVHTCSRHPVSLISIMNLLCGRNCTFGSFLQLLKCSKIIISSRLFLRNHSSIMFFAFLLYVHSNLIIKLLLQIFQFFWLCITMIAHRG